MGVDQILQGEIGFFNGCCPLKYPDLSVPKIWDLKQSVRSLAAWRSNLGCRPGTSKLITFHHSGNETEWEDRIYCLLSRRHWHRCRNRRTMPRQKEAIYFQPCNSRLYYRLCSHATHTLHFFCKQLFCSQKYLYLFVCHMHLESFSGTFFWGER